MSKKIKDAYVEALEEIATEYEHRAHDITDCKLCFMTGRFPQSHGDCDNNLCFLCPEILFVSKFNGKGLEPPCRKHGGTFKDQKARGKYLRDTVIPKVKKAHANSNCFSVNKLEP